MLCKLKDIIRRVKDNVDAQNTELEFYIGGEHFDNCEVLITKKGVIKGSTIGPAFHMRFRPGQVLLMSRNPHLRKAGMVDFEGICSDVSYVCETNDEQKFKQRLIPFLFQSDIFWKTAEANKKGSTNFFLNWSDFEKFEFNVPEPEEQEKLADLLWAAEETRQAYKKLIKQTDDLVQAKFAEMFDGGKDCTLSDLADIIMGQSPDSKYYNTDGQGVAFYQGKTEFADKYIGCPVNWCTNPTRLAEKDDVLMSVRAPVGSVNIAVGHCCIGRGLCAIRAKQGVSLPMFIYFALKTKEKDIEGMGVGSTFKAINKDVVKSIKIPCDTISKQQEFVLFAEQAEQTKLATQQSLEALNATVRALVNRNFN